MNNREHALDALRQAGFEWVHDPDLRAHLDRHRPGSLTVGSKFSPKAWLDIDAIHEQAETQAIIALAQALERGGPLRVEVLLPYEDAGTQGIASTRECSQLPALTRTRIVRDPGTIYEKSLEVVVLDKQHPFPATHQIIAPAGVMGETKTVGLYTLFPGGASRPFPRAEQAQTDPQFHQANVAFWEDHFFLATPEEALCALDASLQALKHSGNASEESVLYHDREIRRIAALAAQVPRTPSRGP
jgi:hypothetical protein